MTYYLSRETVLAVHDVLIDRFGGSHGLRDGGLLDAALARPQTGYYPDIIGEAAALWESICQNHAFVDGNKRVGFAVADLFLLKNGLEIAVDAQTAFAFIIGLYEDGKFRFEELDRWLRLNARERPPKESGLRGQQC